MEPESSNSQDARHPKATSNSNAGATGINASAKQEALEERKLASAKVSEQCRFFGLGFLALSYTILINDSDIVREFNIQYSVLIFWLGTCGAVTLGLDFLQYFSSYLQAEHALKNITGNYRPKRQWLTTRIRYFSYYAKQLTCLTGVVLMITTSLLFFRHSTEETQVTTGSIITSSDYFWSYC